MRFSPITFALLLSVLGTSALAAPNAAAENTKAILERDASPVNLEQAANIVVRSPQDDNDNDNNDDNDNDNDDDDDDDGFIDDVKDGVENVGDDIKDGVNDIFDDDDDDEDAAGMLKPGVGVALIAALAAAVLPL